MPRKRSPIFNKVSNLLKISIFIAKMGKPICSNLIFLKKSRKLKKFKPLKHYKYYGFIEEYQFSPSNTPLFHYPKKAVKSRSRCDIFSMCFLCQRLVSLKAEGGDHGDYPLEALPAVGDTVAAGELLESWDSGDEEDSVDQRAERFIERFYEEMRMQRQESVLQLHQ